ncbi:hypothetical protein PybrP1_001468 [[Pythium] brassicae (nom. inval.)]|nr:hypothetical protein PybrP1_001468 [[Pythium] brassicae (nom. inval.)]
MQSVLGIAKNVNGRRAATAYHLLPGVSPGVANADPQQQPQPQQLTGAAALDSATPSPEARKAAAAAAPSPRPSLSSSLSSSSLASLGALDAASSSRLSMPTSASAGELLRLNSSSSSRLAPTSAPDADADWPVSRHGSAVDKTNPFIGYFQTGRDVPPAPTGLPPRSTSGAAAAGATSSYSSLLSQPKRIADWIGSRSTRLPSLFSKREPGGDTQPPLEATLERQGNAGHQDTKGGSLAGALRAAATSLSVSPKKEEPQTRDALSPAALGAASSSRFAQDFELVEALGHGGQGAVFKARSKVDGCLYAIKKVALPSAALDDPAALEQARREAVSMAAIPPHSNVVRYHSAWLEVEAIQRMSSSTASVRGSDVPNDDECLGVASEPSGEELDELADDASFSVDNSSLSANFEHSFGGFAFEDPSHSMVSFTDELGAGAAASASSGSSSSSASRDRLSGVGKSKLTLYIQMELCSTLATPAAREDETFDRFVDRLTQRPSPLPPPAQYSNLTQWLRSSASERSYAADATRAAKHAEGLKLFLGVAQGSIFADSRNASSAASASLSSQQEQLQQRGSGGRTAEYGDHTTALGTFTYASPEQLGHRGNSSKDASRVLTAVRHGVVPQKALQRYPAEMALVLRMTAVDPAERPTADEICEQIRSLLHAQSAVSARSALDDIRDLQAKLALAVHQLRDRSQTALQLESLVAEMNDKIQTIGLALA